MPALTEELSHAPLSFVIGDSLTLYTRQFRDMVGPAREHDSFFGGKEPRTKPSQFILSVLTTGQVLGALAARLFFNWLGSLFDRGEGY